MHSWILTCCVDNHKKHSDDLQISIVLCNFVTYTSVFFQLENSHKGVKYEIDNRKLRHHQAGRD